MADLEVSEVKRVKSVWIAFACIIIVVLGIMALDLTRKVSYRLTFRNQTPETIEIYSRTDRSSEFDKYPTGSMSIQSSGTKTLTLFYRSRGKKDLRFVIAVVAPGSGKRSAPRSFMADELLDVEDHGIITISEEDSTLRISVHPDLQVGEP